MKISKIEVEYIQHVGDDNAVVNAARCSFHKEAKNYTEEQNHKLIKYLANNRHLSPFNHSFITLRVKAPIFVARQLVKHKFMPWNEVSRRYVDDEPEFYIPDVRKRADNVKQGSSDDVIEDLKWQIYYNTERDLAVYQGLLNKGAAPEVARAVLPQNMMTEWWWSGTLGAYADMLRLRLDPHTQYESRIVANKVKDIIQPLFPVSLNALLEVK